MKTLFATLLVLTMASGTALAADSKRCGPTGQFMGYGFTAQKLPCWVLFAFDNAGANGTSNAE